MKFKIRNEFFPLKICCGVLPVLWFFSLVATTLTVENIALRGITLAICVSLLALIFLSMILFFVDKAIGAVIEVDDTTVKVTQLFGRKKIAIKDIDDIEIEDYQRRVIRRLEYRMKMTILYGGGKKLVLTDNASEIKGILAFLTAERTPLPDQEVTVCKACKYIGSKMEQD